MYKYTKDGFVELSHSRDSDPYSVSTGRGVAIKLEPYAKAPRRAHASDAGADVCALLIGEESKTAFLDIEPGESRIIDTGVSVKVPVGYAIFVLPRSSMRAKQVTCYGDGLIDSDYRGTVKLVVGNHGKTSYRINNHDKIGQFVLQAVGLVDYVDIWNDTDRGTGGFGSTGK